jgi:hypothetical protein
MKMKQKVFCAGHQSSSNRIMASSKCYPFSRNTHICYKYVKGRIGDRLYICGFSIREKWAFSNISGKPCFHR